MFLVVGGGWTFIIYEGGVGGLLIIQYTHSTDSVDTLATFSEHNLPMIGNRPIYSMCSLL